MTPWVHYDFMSPLCYEQGWVHYEQRWAHYGCCIYVYISAQLTPCNCYKTWLLICNTAWYPQLYTTSCFNYPPGCTIVSFFALRTTRTIQESDLFLWAGFLYPNVPSSPGGRVQRTCKSFVTPTYHFRLYPIAQLKRNPFNRYHLKGMLVWLQWVLQNYVRRVLKLSVVLCSMTQSYRYC